MVSPRREKQQIVWNESRKEIRSTLTTETKTAREKENCAEHAGSRIILRNVQFLLDGPEIGNGKPRDKLDFVIDA